MVLNNVYNYVFLNIIYLYEIYLSSRELEYLLTCLLNMVVVKLFLFTTMSRFKYQRLIF